MKKLLLLIIPFILLLGGCSEEKINISPLALHEIAAESFLFSKEEISELSKWNKSSAELINDALSGNRAALYIMGIGHLKGKYGMACVPGYGKWLIAKSASLGFAPAFAFIALNSDPFTAITYFTMAISAGHSELVPAYDKIKKQILTQLNEAFQEACNELDADYKEFSQKFLTKPVWSFIKNEISRIIAHKKDMILINQNNLKEFDHEKDEFIFSIAAITHEDLLFDGGYYAKNFLEKSSPKIDLLINDNEKIIQQKIGLAEEYHMIRTFIIMRDWGIKTKSSIN